MRRITIFLIILAVILGIIGFWFYQRNIFSKEVLKLEILGPSEVTIGQEIEYLVKYKNTGQITLEEAKLIFEYPENSLPTEGENLRIEKTLGDIYPGKEETISFKGRIFGKEDEVKVAKAWLNFRPKNLKAFFESSTTLTSQIKSVPLTFEFDLGSRAESGREIKFSLNYFSNCDFPLSNLGIKIEYPSGFEFLESRPKGLDKTEWSLPLLNKTEGGRIEIGGKLIGELFEQKIFKASLGIWKENQYILLKEARKGVEIIKPSIYISYQINGSANYVASLGDLLYYEIFFRNIGDSPFENLFLAVQLEGESFDLETLRVDVGEFRKGENTILWDSRVLPKLRFLEAGEEGKVEFWVKLKTDLPISSDKDKNPRIKAKITLGQVKEEFVTKINSKLIITQRGVFSDSVFQNSGPIPPRVGQTTTYTISWQVKNYYNDLKNVKVKANLPSQVRLTGLMKPGDARLTFDQNSREIVWEIGDLNWGTGVLTQAPELAFQIAFTPSPDQRGQAPTLISEAKISGEDTWAESEIQAMAPGINTTLLDDQIVSEQQGIVQ
ncbi:MAG: hypothetical protein COX34_01700 [Candidatus Nealsonbacteria bacterium CG23_combo_of_CG06-09_8_20_14_all_36_12]|uniref:DUF11 domain-containing protein n=2 Tax=Candidatus Nealsoniibacteriota TaxID=1817911 RepID=A0A2H0TL23_9BACT|nr:MAG: hypothetical protein COX34_01700 [Candidatus Nealsonbacteria bacterium CG23_combo_of_CG06-09_8_20_14_all_36_12]PIR72848.1 MAG: hypothetical protein COV26_01725 [Candidatus Nealsonbacteria bacterium CG10_big_fil_rev_8_21_14_0_10_36_23]